MVVEARVYVRRMVPQDRESDEELKIEFLFCVCVCMRVHIYINNYVYCMSIYIYTYMYVEAGVHVRGMRPQDLEHDEGLFVS